MMPRSYMLHPTKEQAFVTATDHVLRGGQSMVLFYMGCHPQIDPGNAPINRQRYVIDNNRRVFKIVAKYPDTAELPPWTYPPPTIIHKGPTDV